MMKIAKRITSAVIVLVMLCSSVVIFASAANVKDESWTFIFTTLTQTTEHRIKDNTTKIYWKVNSISSGYSYTVKPFAYVPSTGAYIDCSHGITRTINATGVYYLTNWVYEDGYRRACVRGTATQAFSSSGVWSPDNSSGI